MSENYEKQAKIVREKVKEQMQIQSDKENDDKLAELVKTWDVDRICYFLKMYCKTNNLHFRVYQWRSSRGREVCISKKDGWRNIHIWMKIKFNPKPYFYICAGYYFYDFYVELPKKYTNLCSFIKNMIQQPLAVSDVYKSVNEFSHFHDENIERDLPCLKMQIKSNDKIYDGCLIGYDYLWTGDKQSYQKHYILQTNKGIMIFSENDVDELL